MEVVPVKLKERETVKFTYKGNGSGGTLVDMYLSHDYDDADIGTNGKNYAFSVRCVKDD